MLDRRKHISWNQQYNGLIFAKINERRYSRRGGYLKLQEGTVGEEGTLSYKKVQSERRVP
jgi:hypothetical protein